MFFLVDDIGGLFFGRSPEETLALVGEYDIEFTGVATAGDGRVFAIDRSTLYEISLVDFGLTVVGDLGITDATSFTIDDAGTALVHGDERTILSTVDLETGAATDLADAGVTALSIEVGENVFIATTDGTLAAVAGDLSPVFAVETGIVGLEGLAAVDETLFGFAEDLVFDFSDEENIQLIGELDSPGDAPLSEVTGAAGIEGTGEGISLEQAQELALLYFGALDFETPDVAGFNYWADQLEAGLSLSQVSFFMADSVDFSAITDPSAPARTVVEEAYQTILGREGEEAGVDFWTNALETEGFGFTDLVLEFSLSEENVFFSTADDQVAELAAGFWNFIG